MLRIKRVVVLTMMMSLRFQITSRITFLQYPKHIMESTNENVHSIHREDILRPSSKISPDRIPLILPFHPSIYPLRRITISNHVANHFSARQYPKHIMESTNQNVYSIHREDILRPSSKISPDRIPLILPFHPSIYPLRRITISNHVANHFSARQYPKHIMESTNQNVHSIHREDILRPSSKISPDRIPLILPFHPSIYPLRRIILKHYKSLMTDQNTKDIFKLLPIT